jgi:hypothetical protein
VGELTRATDKKLSTIANSPARFRTATRRRPPNRLNGYSLPPGIRFVLPIKISGLPAPAEETTGIDPPAIRPGPE